MFGREGQVSEAMKDWAVSFIAAVLIVGLIIWCAKVLIWAFA
jgi:hypothetical protein